MSTRQAALSATIALALFAATAIWLILTQTEKTGMLLEPEDQQAVAAGKAVYVAQCASCHGSNLEGQPDWKSPGSDGLMPAPPHDETGHTWHHPDEVLFNITKLGVVKAAGLSNYESAMPAYEELLSDEEIVAVLSYIKSTWPDPIRTRHNEMNERYAKEPKS